MTLTLTAYKHESKLFALQPSFLFGELFLRSGLLVFYCGNSLTKVY